MTDIFEVMGSRLRVEAARSKSGSVLRAFLVEVEQNPGATMGSKEISQLTSIIFGWRVALSAYGIEDRWAKEVLPITFERLRENFEVSEGASLTYILEQASSDINERLAIYFETLWETELLLSKADGNASAQGQK